MMKRAAGVLLPVTSLPSAYGIGCFSKEAYDFVDLLAETGQTYWQILPLGPTSYGPSDDSPYQAYSAFAGNPYLIDLEQLIAEGVLSRQECDAVDFGADPTCVDFDKLHDHRYVLLRRAYERSDISRNPDYQHFLQDNRWWLDDYALFMAVKRFFGESPWYRWPEDIRKHWGFALDYYRRELYFEVEFQQYMQFVFFRQWQKLKAYANSRHIQIVGDIPIYVSHDSADVWAHPELFQINGENELSAVAGCPPDAFSADGQLWGNPLYRWEYHRSTGYEWWMSRLWQSFRLFDVVRIDHFRGLDEYYSIPVGATPLEGTWEKGPGMELFHAIRHHLGEKQLIAEDLGHMTEGVRRLVRDSGVPNMKVLQFAFDVDDAAAANDHLPHNYHKNCVVYTGTHDNETLMGWLQEMEPAQKRLVRDYLCDTDSADEALRHRVVALAMGSCANVCIVALQDYLGLDNSCRMNQPATVKKNWRWRMKRDAVKEEHRREMRTLTTRYGRLNWDNEPKGVE